MIFTPIQSAQRRWQRIKGFRKLALVPNKVPFRNSKLVNDQSARFGA